LKGFTEMLAPVCECRGWRYTGPFARLQLWGCKFDPHDFRHSRQLISESAILRIQIEAGPHVEALGFSKNGAVCSREIAMDKISIVENDPVAFFFFRRRSQPELHRPGGWGSSRCDFLQARRCRFQFLGGMSHEWYPSSGSDRISVTGLRFQSIGTRQ
jgi:hypothetical protein